MVHLYMLYCLTTHRAFLWHSSKRDDCAAVAKAKTLLTPDSHGKLYTGPTGVDEMDFLENVYGTL